jgi:Ca2+-binding RTX toxin-like protein
VAFEDGVVWDKRKLGALALIGGEGSDRLIGYSTDDFLHGHEGDDYLFGGFGNDQLQGGLGNDVLYGESGSDLYLFESDFGMDTINNYRESFSVDSVRFEAASPQDLWFERAGNHLQISAVGADDVVTINNWYSGEAYQVDRIEAGGFTLVNSQVENLVNAMASFDAPVGVGSIIPPMHNDDLAVVLANTWQAN